MHKYPQKKKGRHVDIGSLSETGMEHVFLDEENEKPPTNLIADAQTMAAHTDQGSTSLTAFADTSSTVLDNFERMKVAEDTEKRVKGKKQLRLMERLQSESKDEDNDFESLLTPVQDPWKASNELHLNALRRDDSSGLREDSGNVGHPTWHSQQQLYHSADAHVPMRRHSRHSSSDSLHSLDQRSTYSTGRSSGSHLGPQLIYHTYPPQQYAGSSGGATIPDFVQLQQHVYSSPLPSPYSTPPHSPSVMHHHSGSPHRMSPFAYGNNGGYSQAATMMISPGHHGSAQGGFPQPMMMQNAYVGIQQSQQHAQYGMPMHPAGSVPGSPQHESLGASHHFQRTPPGSPYQHSTPLQSPHLHHLHHTNTPQNPNINNPNSIHLQNLSMQPQQQNIVLQQDDSINNAPPQSLSSTFTPQDTANSPQGTSPILSPSHPRMRKKRLFSGIPDGTASSGAQNTNSPTLTPSRGHKPLKSMAPLHINLPKPKTSITTSGTYHTPSIRIKSTGFTGMFTYGNFETESGVLGRGASSVVIRAVYHDPHSPYDGHKYAIKIVDLKAVEAKVIENEIQSIMNMKSEYVVRLYDAFSREGSIHMVLEYMELGSLEDVCKVLPQHRIPDDVLRELAGQLIQGLAYLEEKQIVHRDIKPANCLLNKKGRCKLGDFGFSRRKEEDKDVLQTYQGSMTYMSPERIQGKEHWYNSDVWSLGVTILECALGRYPFHEKGQPQGEGLNWWQAQNLIEKGLKIESSEVSPDLEDFVRQCTVVDPLARLNASELVNHRYLVLNSTSATRKWIKHTYKKAKVDHVARKRQQGGSDLSPQ